MDTTAASAGERPACLLHRRINSFEKDLRSRMLRSLVVSSTLAVRALSLVSTAAPPSRRLSTALAASAAGIRDLGACAVPLCTDAAAGCC